MTLTRTMATLLVVGALLASASAASTAATNRTGLVTSDQSTVGSNVFEATASTPVQANETANVTIVNQTTSGDRVRIASVTVPNGGFVVVHDARLLQGNVLGSIAGVSAHLEPGTHANVTVPVTAPLNRSQRVIAIAYRDSNGNGTFDYRSSEGSLDGPYRKNELVVSDDALVETANGTTAPAGTTADTGTKSTSTDD
ncbi:MULTISPECIES: hypothetical protein [Halorussus]|uniref:DUF7282 domain-containing protein n=1 Tax=Halorussus TaxID=1070314 RepID=UPI000E20D7A8|nr:MULTISPECIES: hypothetical protein [Halorussus]NHN58010.1 hypothetical protein [Halorussus sp. JP-T4]